MKFFKGDQNKTGLNKIDKNNSQHLLSGKPFAANKSASTSNQFIEEGFAVDSVFEVALLFCDFLDLSVVSTDYSRHYGCLSSFFILDHAQHSLLHMKCFYLIDNHEE